MDEKEFVIKYILETFFNSSIEAVLQDYLILDEEIYNIPIPFAERLIFQGIKEAQREGEIIDEEYLRYFLPNGTYEYSLQMINNLAKRGLIKSRISNEWIKKDYRI